MNATEFHVRVQDCLDARIDPLDDAELCSFLDRHPEHLTAFAELRTCLAAITALGMPAGAPPRRRPRRRLLVVVAAAAVAILAVGSASHEVTARPPSLVLASALREQRPRLNVAASFEVREVIVSPTTRLEIYERRTEPR